MAQLLSSRAAVLCHLVRAELLPFMPRFPPNLSWLPVLSDPPDLWERVIHCQRTLLRHGGPGAVPDLILVATALHHRIPVFSVDEDFGRYADALPLRLWVPS
jgi:predicted nucleic acid-binding protein